MKWFLQGEVGSNGGKRKERKRTIVADKHPRETTFEKLQQFKPVFEENGVVTAGNASVSGLLYKAKWYVSCLIYP